MSILTVKAGVRAGQSLLVAIITVNVESVDAIHSLELFKAVERYFTCARDELQQLGQLLLVEGSNRAPEPLDLLTGWRVVVVLGVVLPVVHIDVWQTRDEELELLFVENGNKFCWDNFVETYKASKVSMRDWTYQIDK